MQTLLNVFKYVVLGVLIVGLASTPFMAFNAYADFDYTPEQWYQHVLDNIDYYKSIGINFVPDEFGQAFAESALTDGTYFVITKYWYTMPFELTFEYIEDEEAFLTMVSTEWYDLDNGFFIGNGSLAFAHPGFDSGVTVMASYSGDEVSDMNNFGSIVVIPYNDTSTEEPTSPQPTSPQPTGPSSPPAGGDNGTFIQTVGNMLSSVMAWVGAVLTALFTASGAFNGLIVFIGIGTAVALILFVRKLVQKFRKQ